MSRSSANCWARATSRPVSSNTIDAPSKTSSSWPPTRFTYTTGTCASAARVASIVSRSRMPARVVRRRVDVDDELGAARGLGDDRPGRAPRVLADRDADAHAADDEQRAVDGRRREVALLVEHRVVRQQVLAVDALHLAVRADRGRVGEVAAGLGEADDRGEPAGARGQLLERLGRLGHERRLQQQVLGRVPGERELGERDRGRRRPRRPARRPSRIRAALPARSPTTRSSWAAARRIGASPQDTGADVGARHCET